MPLDSLPLDEAAAAFARFHDEPTLRGLSYALRNPETWPVGFVWEFACCTRCAMGLAFTLLEQPLVGEAEAALVATAHLFDIEFCEAKSLFDQVRNYLGLSIPVGGVTPEHVADAIDRHLSAVAYRPARCPAALSCWNPMTI